MAILFAVLPGFAVDDGTQLDETQRLLGESKQNQIREMLKVADFGISFHGRVIDQYGKPVEDAEVILQLTKFSPNPDSFFTDVEDCPRHTDKDGRFSFSALRGRNLSISTINKTGYDDENMRVGFGGQTSFEKKRSDDQKPSTRVLPIPKSDPAVFIIRKKGDTSYLMAGDEYFDFIIKKNNFGEVALNGSRKSPTEPAPLFWPGFLVTCTTTENPPGWAVTIKGANAGDELLRSDKVLYEAPESGYQSQLTFSMKRTFPRDILECQVVLKSMKPVTYSLANIRLDADSEGLRVSSGISINPYGTRILEREVQLGQFEDLEERLYAEARAAFFKGENPPTPDLKKLIAEEQKKEAAQQ